jgi:hypothetical protein
VPSKREDLQARQGSMSTTADRHFCRRHDKISTGGRTNQLTVPSGCMKPVTIDVPGSFLRSTSRPSKPALCSLSGSRSCTFGDT